MNEEYIFWDTQIGAFLLNENEPTHALKPLYDKYIFNVDIDLLTNGCCEE